MPVFPNYGQHKTSTSPENKGAVSNENQRRHKTAISQGGTIPNKRVLCKVKRGTPTQAQEKEQLILFCLYLCLCFILSCLQHKFKDNFACVARENYNPVQNGRKNVNLADTPKIKDGKIMARLKATCLVFGGIKACCSILS